MSHTQQIYVVIGDTGEYSDYHEWIVCAYTREEDAIQRVKFLSAVASDLHVNDRDVRFESWQERGAAEKKIKVVENGDPNASIDYTGIRWRYEAITLRDSF